MRFFTFIACLPLGVVALRSAIQDVDSDDESAWHLQVEDAALTDWLKFDWKKQCLSTYWGSAKVVCQLKDFPDVAVISVLAGSGQLIIEQELNSLGLLKDAGLRVVPFATKIFDIVPYYRSDLADGEAENHSLAKAYLMRFFSQDAAFYYEEGEPGTEDYMAEPMWKLRITNNDEGIWGMNRRAIEVVKENHLEAAFMEDISRYVKLMMNQGDRILDYQTILAKDGHLYIADPQAFAPTGYTTVNRYFLEGVFETSDHPKRCNKAGRPGFVDALGVELGVDVLDESHWN